MSGALTQIAQSIAASPVHDVVLNWLRTVPGLPPIVQAIHILSVAFVMASIVMIDLRVLRIAGANQALTEMTRRLVPWLWSALLLLLLSGSMFVIARPRRYFVNPVFGLKFALLFVAVLASAVLLRQLRKGSSPLALKSTAALSLLAWIGTMLAGRWIAYADYLFPPE